MLVNFFCYISFIGFVNVKGKGLVRLKEAIKKNDDRNGGIWQSGISKSLAECQVLCGLRQCTVVFA